MLAGERYKNVSKEVKNYFAGLYGKAPGEVNQELAHKILGEQKAVTGRFADTLEPYFEKAKAEIGSLAKSDEDVLSYIAFPAQAEAFLKKREEKAKNTVKYTITKIS